MRRALAYGLFALLVIALIAALQASAAPAASGVFSLDRLRLGGSSGAEDYVFTAGNVIFPDGGADTGSYYKFVVTDGAATVRNPSFPCTPASSFSSADNTYAVQASDPTSTGTGWKYTLKQYATSTCSGGATKTASKTFYVARATVYADGALTTPKTGFGAGATAYVTVTGVTPSLTGWSTTWLLPSGATACANTAGTDRPDSSSSSNLPPKWTNSYLQYRPNTTATGSAWNREANYDVRPCPSFDPSNEGTWKLRLDGNATNFVVLPVFTVDTTPPPPPTITSAPPDSSNAASASFGFLDTEAGVGFRCQLDGSAFTPCSSPALYAGLSDGSHTFRVKAVDAAGNESGTIARTWTVDTTPPLVSLAAPADGSSTADATPTFSGSAGGANGDSSTVTVLVYSGSSATGTAVRTLSTLAGLDGSYAVAPSDPLPNGTYTAQAQQSDLAGNTGTSTANTFTVAVAVPVPPTNLSPPTIAGTAQQGQMLSASSGGWSGTAPFTYAYQWRRCDTGGANCADIAGASAPTYTLVAADLGTTIRVAVTASNSAGSSSQSSAQTAVVTPSAAPPVNTSPPTISGTAQQGQRLSASTGAWSGTAPFAYVYQWRRCDTGGGSCADIAGASATTYTLAAADLGTTIRVAVTASNSAGSSVSSSIQTPTVTAAGSVGFRDQSFSGAGVAPTGSKPESKLWWNDGRWWASMWAGSGQGFHIFRLNLGTQSWTDTGTQLDDRSGTRTDALWDGSHLYVASHVFATCGCSTPASGYPSRLYRYSYNATTKSYALDAGFPVQLNNTKTETLVIDKDSTGTLWATWAQSNKVMVTHTQNGDDHSWATPFILPVAGSSTLSSDDISSLVAFGGNKIGVMWSNHTDSTMYFAYHVDGAADSSWTANPAISSPLYADDHINLKSLQSDGSGRVFAVTKTSLNDPANPNPNDPLVLLSVFTPAAGWATYPVWRVSDGVTRPILFIDQSNFVLHVFASSSVSGGRILEKTSPINSISFAVGTGTTFMKDGGSNSLNNATSTKQNLTSASGLVILASNDTTGYYWHNYEPF